MSLLIICLSLFFPSTVVGQWVQIGQPIYGEAQADFSGAPVSINYNGDVIAIGADRNDTNGMSSGQVRVFKYSNGTWVQLGDNLNGSSEEDFFGKKLRLNSDGNKLVISAIGKDIGPGNNNRLGEVKVFEFVQNSWVQLGDSMVGDHHSDMFGSAVDINNEGNIVAVGSKENDVNGNNSGSVKVFELNGDNWTQIGQNILGESSDDEFGISLRLNGLGNILVVGGSYNDGNGENAGHARVFQYTNETWIQIGEDIDGEAAGDQFGRDVSIDDSGNRIAISGYLNSGSGFRAGHVRIFDLIANNWVQIGDDIEGENDEDVSGTVISLSGDGESIAIGAVRNSEVAYYSGHARVFQFDGDNWIQKGDDIDGQENDDQSGWVALNYDGSILANGTPGSDNFEDGVGEVRVYEFGAVGIDDQEDYTISLFPNPTQSSVFLKSDVSEIRRITILDHFGRTIQQMQFDKTKSTDIILPKKNGIYILDVEFDNGTEISRKVVKSVNLY